jgi:hypothetical protein
MVRAVPSFEWMNGVGRGPNAVHIGGSGQGRTAFAPWRSGEFVHWKFGNGT